MTAYKFEPEDPFFLFDSALGRFNRDSEFLDDLIREHIDMGGVRVEIYRLMGTYPQETDAIGNLTAPDLDQGVDVLSFLNIQDPVLGENRDRKYNIEEVPTIRGVYQVSQYELEYAKFAMVGLTNDIITMEFHLKGTEQALGRRLIPGDVVHMTHLREVAIDGRIADKWYEVQSVVKTPGGYDAMYGFHVIGVVMRPMRNSQEFADITSLMDQYGKTLAEQARNQNKLIALTAAVQDLADKVAPTTFWDTTQMWVDPKNKCLSPSRWTDDGKPPDGIIPVDQGRMFPRRPVEWSYFVRTDFVPNRLFQFYDSRWHLKEIDEKREWQPYAWTAKLREFMSDRSALDQARKYELKSIHDVITTREDSSDPSPRKE